MSTPNEGGLPDNPLTLTSLQEPEPLAARTSSPSSTISGQYNQRNPGIFHELQYFRCTM